MPAPPLSVARMFAYGHERSVRAASAPPGAAERRSRRENLQRHLLEYVLMDPAARTAFTRRIAGTDGEPLAYRTSSRALAGRVDLVAELTAAPASPEPGDPSAEAPGGTGATGGPGEATARVGVLVRVDSAASPESIRDAVAALGDSPHSRLVVLVPRGGKPDLAAAGLAEDPRVRVRTWTSLVKQLSRKEKNEDRAELWRVLGELGEDDPDLTAHRLVGPKILLDEDVVAQFRAQLDAMRLVCETLYGRGPRFSTSRTARGAWLHAGGSGEGLGVEFGEVEDGTPIWFVGARPARTFPLGIGALPDDATRERALRRLRGIAAGSQWRSDPAYRPHLPGFIGVPASRAFEDARALLWEVMDPRSLTAAGFPPVPREQPILDDQRLAVRVRSAESTTAGTLLVSVGGSPTWRTLLPRVTREFDHRTYIVQARKHDTPADLVAGVHAALRSLATKP